MSKGSLRYGNKSLPGISARFSKMPERCVAARCGNIKDEANGISMHRIPFFGTTCLQRLRRRKKWIDFTLERRKICGRAPVKTSSLCSMHFNDEDFTRLMNSGSNLKRELK